MNRCNLTKAFLNEVKEGLRGKKVKSKTQKWIQKWKPQLKFNRKVWYNGKVIVPKEETHEVLRRLLLQGACPLSIEGCFNYILPKMWGFPRRHIRDFIQSTERYQLMKVRTRNPERARAVNPRKKEGATTFLQMKKYYSGPTNMLAIDLMEIPKEWSSSRYFFCAVHAATKRSWFVPMPSKTAQKTLTTFKKILAEVTRDIGEVTELTSDKGGEFVNKIWEAFLKRKGIKHRTDNKAFIAEKKIQEFGRIFGYLRNMYGPRKSLDLAVKKLNNVRSRLTGRAPSSFQKSELQGHIFQRNRKLRKNPKHKNPVVYKAPNKKTKQKGDRVRYALKHQEYINIMYKSYTPISRKPKYSNWSKEVVPILAVRNSGGEKVYKIQQGDRLRWKKAWELQKVKTVVKLEPDKEAPVSRAVKQQRKKDILRKPRNLGIELKGWDLKALPKKRVRKKVKYT